MVFKNPGLFRFWLGHLYLPDGAKMTENAPYGYKADGTPRIRAGRPPGARTKPRLGSARGTGASAYARTVIGDEEFQVDDLPADPEPAPFPGEPVSGLTPDPVSVIGPDRGEIPVSRARAAAKGKAVTAAVRKDIRGKLAFMGLMVTSMWQVSDPYCGGAAAGIIPELSEAITDLVVDSADLVAWFTAGGSYMKWLTLATVLQPVTVVIWQHHVSHTIGDTEDEHREQFDPQLYSATA
jgi:hypothetical protein